LWLGTESNGLLYYHPDRFKFKNYDASFFNISDNKRLAIHCMIDYHHDLLVGTENGLYHYSSDRKSFQLFSGIPAMPFAINWFAIAKTELGFAPGNMACFASKMGKSSNSICLLCANTCTKPPTAYSI
jgi:ligand-binding sensor domain-containing protein